MKFAKALLGAGMALAMAAGSTWADEPSSGASAPSISSSDEMPDYIVLYESDYDRAMAGEEPQPSYYLVEPEVVYLIPSETLVLVPYEAE